jgi:uncharacterized membrane protein
MLIIIIHLITRVYVDRSRLGDLILCYVTFCMHKMVQACDR